MAKIDSIRSLVSNHQSNSFPNRLNKHLNFVTFVREYSYEFCKVQENQRYFEGAIFGANSSFIASEFYLV